MVTGIAGLLRPKKIPRLDPSACALECILRIRLEHQPLTGTEPTNIHQRVISLRQLAQKIVLIQFRRQIDITLRPAQSLEVSLYVLAIGDLGSQMADHESGVDKLTKTKLFHDIEGRAKQAGVFMAPQQFIRKVTCDSKS